MADLLKL